MNICIPITRDNGIQSPVSLHFGSAPIFMVVDTESGSCRAITNRNLHHDHGMCQPLAQLAGENLDAMVVGGIGMGAFGKLKTANIRVYFSEHATVEETVAAFKIGNVTGSDPGDGLRASRQRASRPRIGGCDGTETDPYQKNRANRCDHPESA